MNMWEKHKSKFVFLNPLYLVTFLWYGLMLLIIKYGMNTIERAMDAVENLMESKE